MKYRDLEPYSKWTVDAITELLNILSGRLAGSPLVKRTFCYVIAPPGGSNPLDDLFFLRPILIPEADAAARETNFVVLLTSDSMEPLYSAGIILLCKREHVSRQEYGLSLLNQEVFIHRLYYRRGITKLVAPNLNFRDTIIHENNSLKCIGIITGIAHGCRRG